MNPLRFKLKDRVIGKGRVGGTIVAFGKHYFDYCVEFDEPIMDAHDIGDDVYKYGHCRWVNDDELEPYGEAIPTPYFADTLGGSSPGGNQTLFYSKPIFDLPPPPRRKVKKVIAKKKELQGGANE